jgi:ribonuclease HI
MAKKQKFYVVWKGKTPGVYDSWKECADQVNGFSGAEYKSFDTLAAARQAFQGEYQSYVGQSTRQADQVRLLDVGQPIWESWSVDAACNPVPGRMEYRGVHTQTKEEIFSAGPFEDGTNNVGEFLAIVHALTEAKRRGLTLPIYSDSRNAILWVQQGRCRTNLEPTSNNQVIFDLIKQAENWLASHDFDNEILKWETDVWGENPADYGRK